MPNGSHMTTIFNSCSFVQVYFKRRAPRC